MQLNEKTALAEIDFFCPDQLIQLAEFGISTLGELLGATQGLQRFPTEDIKWGNTFAFLREVLLPSLLQLYQDPVSLPQTGLRKSP